MSNPKPLTIPSPELPAYRWTLESAPIRSPIGALIPTRQATPALDQPFVVKVVRTDESPLGAMTLFA